MRAGVRIALDPGMKRIGVARCDRDAIMAVPLDTLDAANDAWVQECVRLVEEYQPIELIVGNPVSLRGHDELASVRVRERIAPLRAALPTLPIRLVDERLTTATALKQLQTSGKSAKESRKFVDAAAAVGILEFALEYERKTGKAAGEDV